ncbi:MAG: LAGLIDADG family homing endonuclease [Candidatus Aenigmatarchaeota archaeon]
MKQDASGRFLKNSVPWNKDKKGVYSKNVIAKMSEAKKGRRTSINTEFKKGQIPWNKNLKGLNLSGGKGWFEKGHRWESEINNKRLENLREKVLIKPKLESNENLTYILGVLFGDGCVYKSSRSYRICLDVTDQNFSMSFFQALKKIRLNPFIQERLPSNGIGKRKKYIVIANSKVFGEWYKNISLLELEKILTNRENITGFLRGFYESEGQLYRNKSGSVTLYIHNTNLDLLKLLKKLSQQLGFNFKLYGPYKNSSNLSCNKKLLYRLSLNSKYDSHKFLQLIKPSIKNL